MANPGGTHVFIFKTNEPTLLDERTVAKEQITVQPLDKEDIGRFE
jgi:hypothetical protein